MEVSLNIRDNEKFLAQFPVGAFLQSRFWARFLTLQGVKNWQLNVSHQNQVLAQCLLYSTNLPFGKSFLYAPKGPLIAGHDQQIVKEAFALILTQIRDITIATRKRQEIFCRLEPNQPPLQLDDISHLPTEAIQPQTTMLLDLTQPADQLFSNFKEKTRYNIRLAEKKGLRVYWDNGTLGLEKFLALLPKTSHRQKIKSHALRHYRHLIQAGQESGNLVQVAWAQQDRQLLAANIYIFYGSTVTYLHGSFDYQYRELMAPYLLQWQAIQRAKELGFPYYDFGGLAPADNSKPSWAGFSRFKSGFQGQIVTAPGAFDFIYIPFWYNIYSELREYNRRLRRLF